MISSPGFIAILLLVGLGAQADSAGSLHRDYPIAGFDRIYFTGAGTLRLTQGTQPALNAMASAEVLDRLVIETYDGALFIESPESARDHLVIELTVMNVREVVNDGRGVVTSESLKVSDLLLEGRGNGSFQLDELQADELIVTSYGETEFALSGHVNRQVLELESTGYYRAPNLASHSVEATVTGTGFIFLAVEDLLDIELEGTARVRYAGSPFVSQRVSGPGSVTRVQEHSI